MKMTIEEAIEAVQQPRSRYQMEHFVLGQHDTPEMQFEQLCSELFDLRRKLIETDITNRKLQVEIRRLLETGDEIDALEAELKQVQLENTKIVMLGAEREVAVLMDIFDSIPHFTRDEIEHAQPEYWKARLTRQTNLQIMSGNVSWGQLDSMRQVGLLDEMVEERERQLMQHVEKSLSDTSHPQEISR